MPDSTRLARSRAVSVEPKMEVESPVGTLCRASSMASAESKDDNVTVGEKVSSDQIRDALEGSETICAGRLVGDAADDEGVMVEAPWTSAAALENDVQSCGFTCCTASDTIPCTSCTEPGRTISNLLSLISSIHRLSSACSSSATSRCTRTRSVDMQICPELSIAPKII